MAERDPFGRLPDENPLAGLGSLSDGSTGQVSEPFAAAAPSSATSDRESSFSASPSSETSDRTSSFSPPPPAPAAARQRPPATARPQSPAVDQSLADAIRRAQAMSGVNVAQSVRVGSRVVRLVVLLIVIGVIASVGSTVIDAGKSVRDTVNNNLPSPSKISDQIKAATPDVKPPAAPKAGPTPRGLSSSSLLARGNFARAMNRLSKSGLGHVRNLTIRPERIDAQLLTSGGRLRSLQIRYDDPKIDAFSLSGAGFSHLETIPFSKIDAGAPARAARGAAGRTRRPVGQIDYVVLISFASKPTWSAFMKGGKQFLADEHGRITHSIG